MNTYAYEFGAWAVECIPEDGARLSRLRFQGHDLLTQCPELFRPPTRDFGVYETRPVYGYDDCFPTVDPCELPDRLGVCLRDHGELCWVPWEVSVEPGRLTCRTRSPVYTDVQFVRTLNFTSNTLMWQFEVVNGSAESIRFMHVMHALMPVENVVDVRLPGFETAVDESTSRTADFTSAAECARRLLNQPRGSARMLLLRGVREGSFMILFSSGLELAVEWPIKLLPTLGIWWNDGGYPDEDGCRRLECALEPIPGPWSSLARTGAECGGLTAGPSERRTWEITWKVRIGSRHSRSCEAGSAANTNRCMTETCG